MLIDMLRSKNCLVKENGNRIHMDQIDVKQAPFALNFIGGLIRHGSASSLLDVRRRCAAMHL